MDLLLSSSLNSGFENAKQKIRRLYPDFDYEVRYSSRSYSEDDLFSDVSVLWTDIGLAVSPEQEPIETELVESIATLLLIRLYQNKDRLTGTELATAFGGWIKKIWEILTGY